MRIFAWKSPNLNCPELIPIQEGKPPLSDEEIDALEAEFPKLAGAAFAKAYQAAVAAGLTIVEAEDGKIVEISPDGTCRVLKTIAPPTPIQPGQIIMIQ